MDHLITGGTGYTGSLATRVFTEPEPSLGCYRGDSNLLFLGCV